MRKSKEYVEYVIVRADSGVFAGELASWKPRAGCAYADCVIKRARRIWRWFGFDGPPVVQVSCVEQIATNGVCVTNTNPDRRSRVSPTVARIEIADARQYVVATGIARELIERAEWNG